MMEQGNPLGGTKPTEPLVTSSPESPCCSKNVKIVLIVFAVAFVAAISSASAYFFAKSRLQTSTPSPTPIAQASPTPDETANWKTYSSELLGFQFKYPNEPKWNIKEGVQGSNMVTLYNYDVGKAPGRDYSPTDGDLYKIEMTLNKRFSSVDKWFGEEQQEVDPFTNKPYEFLNKKSIKVGSYSGIYFESPVMTGLNCPSAVIETPTKYLVHLYSGLNCEANKNIFDQILSTFKFIETSNPTPSSNKLSFTIPSDWKKYDKDFQGMRFQFKYPANLFIFDQDPDSGDLELRQTENSPASVIMGRMFAGRSPNAEYTGGSRREWFLTTFQNMYPGDPANDIRKKELVFTPVEFTNGNSFYQVEFAQNTQSLASYFYNWGFDDNTSKTSKLYFGVFGNNAVMVIDRDQKVDIMKIMQTLSIK